MREALAQRGINGVITFIISARSNVAGLCLCLTLCLGLVLSNELLLNVVQAENDDMGESKISSKTIPRTFRFGNLRDQPC